MWLELTRGQFCGLMRDDFSFGANCALFDYFSDDEDCEFDRAEIRSSFTEYEDVGDYIKQNYSEGDPDIPEIDDCDDIRGSIPIKGSCGFLVRG